MKKLFLLIALVGISFAANAQSPEARNIAATASGADCETKDPQTGYLTPGKRVTTSTTTTTTTPSSSKTSGWEGKGSIGGEVGTRGASGNAGLGGGYSSSTTNNSGSTTTTTTEECVPLPPR